MTQSGRSGRSKLIRKASHLPTGSPEQRAILAKLQKSSGDPNVALQSVLYNATKVFLEDVVKAILRYSSLDTPMRGKPGSMFSRGSIVYGNLVNRTTGENWGVGVSAQVRGKILIEMSDYEEKVTKKFRFASHETPASIANYVSWVGTAFLMGEEGIK